MVKVKEAALRVHTRTGNVSFGSISATKAEIVAGLHLCVTQKQVHSCCPAWLQAYYPHRLHVLLAILHTTAVVLWRRASSCIKCISRPLSAGPVLFQNLNLT